MQIVAIWIFMELVGFIIIFGTSILGMPFSLLGGMFGGLMMFMGTMQMLGIAKGKGFLALFKNLKDDEQFTWIPGYNNRIKVIITKGRYKGLLYRGEIGLIDNKGTNFNFGKDLMNFAYPWSGYTIDLPTEHYFSKTKEEDNLDTFDEHVKKYLGDGKYEEFKTKFRVEEKKTIDNINAELDWLVEQTAKDKLEKKVFGETIDFRSRCKYLKYNYDPSRVENATEREKIIAYKTALDYKEKQEYEKYKHIAIAVVIIIFGVAMGLALLSSIDLSGIFGLFG